MNRKRIAILFFVVIMTFGLFSCSDFLENELQSPATESPTPEEAASPPGMNDSVKVDVFQYRSEYEDAFRKAAEEFGKENSKIAINVMAPESDQDYGAALRAKFNSGQEPAIFNINGPSDIEQYKTRLLDLSELEAAVYAVESFLAGATVDDKVYGLPFSIEGYGIVYNTEILKKAEINLDEIDSFRAFDEMCKKLDENKKKLGIEAVFAFPVKEPQTAGLLLSNIFISPEFDENIFTAWQAATLEFKYGESFKKLLDLLSHYSVKPAEDIELNRAFELFTTERAAMTIAANKDYSYFEGLNKEFAEKKLAILPFFAEGFNDAVMPVGVPMYWAVNNTGPKEVQEAACDFINWLYISDKGKEIIAERFEFIPAFRGFADGSVGDPLSKELLTQVNAGQTMDWVFMGYPDGWGTKKLAPDILKYIRGELDWGKVINNAKISWAEGRKK